jgi:DNA-directed RNA polymerase
MTENKNNWKLDLESIISRTEQQEIGKDMSLMEQQYMTEAYTLRLSKSLYAEAIKKRGLGQSEAGNSLVSSVLLKVVDAHNAWLALPLRGRSATLKKWFQNECNLSSEQVCFIAISQMLNSLREYSVQSVSLRIGSIILDSMNYQKFISEAGGLYKAILQNVKSSTAIHKHRVLKGAMHSIAEIPDEILDKETRAKVGLRLITTVVEATGLFELAPDGTRTGNKVSALKIHPTPELTEFLDEMNSLMELRKPYNLPMVVPPKPWSSLFDGGYWFAPRSRTSCLIKGVNQQQLNTLVKHDWTNVFEDVNRIQATAWRVNTKVLDIMKQCMEYNFVFAKIPASTLKEIPKEWGDLPDEEWKAFKENNPEKAKAWKYQQAVEHDKFNRGISKRDAIFRTIGVAEQFRLEDELYFPYQLDSRGRAYPTAAVLSPQTGDVAQGLLELAEGKALGVDGLRWLLIDLANCWGEDKVTLDERVVWALDNRDMIINCASDPLNFDMWEKADKPFNFLARCIAFTEASELNDPTSYVSHLGGQLDGSNNGCQHFGAMMRDYKTCIAVNVLPTERPQDVYKIVAEEVQPLIDADLADGGSFSLTKDLSVPVKWVALPWKGKVDRSLVKQPTMTTPYGVTKRGVDGQLQEYIKKFHAEKGKPFTNPHPESNMKQACTYLAGKVDDAINNAMTKAKDAMYFLQDTAEIFSKETNLPIQWVTPNGFLCVQDRRKQKGKRVEVHTGGTKMRVAISMNYDTPDIHPQKARSGIAPNVVHSLDACHMLSTVRTCWDTHGISSFSLIHDSYGVHHADLTKMRDVLREEFVNMYADTNVLQDWKEQVIKQIPEGMDIQLPEVPTQGDADIHQVIGSDYFFA